MNAANSSSQDTCPPTADSFSTADSLPSADRHDAADRMPAADRHDAVDRLPAADRMPTADRMPAADNPPAPDYPPARVALVTGGSRGIGRAICIALAQAGNDVAITYVSNENEAERCAEVCQKAATAADHQVRIITIGGDVAIPDSCEIIFQKTVEALGAPDILVNNAGITRDNLLLRMDIDDFNEVINVNLRSAFIFSKLVARSMLKKRFGRIINISSVVGLAGNAGQANYAASKAGLIGLTKSLAKELGSRSVTVNAIAPGFIDTSMTVALSDEVRERLIGSLSIPRLGTPDDVAALVAFIASDSAQYITGQVIAVDGGLAL